MGRAGPLGAGGGHEAGSPQIEPEIDVTEAMEGQPDPPGLEGCDRGWICYLPRPRPAPSWRGVRVVEGARLEIWCGRKVTVGSNPTLSASRLVRGCNPFERDSSLSNTIPQTQTIQSGAVAEWSKALAWNASVGSRSPWVRIPPSPPLRSNHRSQLHAPGDGSFANSARTGR